MIKLQIKSQGDYSLIRSHNSFKDIGPVDMSNVLKQSLRQGTTIMVENSNTRPEPHRGLLLAVYAGICYGVFVLFSR